MHQCKRRLNEKRVFLRKGLKNLWYICNIFCGDVIYQLKVKEAFSCLRGIFFLGGGGNFKENSQSGQTSQNINVHCILSLCCKMLFAVWAAGTKWCQTEGAAGRFCRRLSPSSGQTRQLFSCFCVKLDLSYRVILFLFLL